MFYFIGVIQLLFLSYLLFRGLKLRGLTFFSDAINIMLLLWLANIGLYNLQLSNLYNPTWQINIIILGIIAIFYFASKKIYLKEEDTLNIMEEIKTNNKDYKIYSRIINVIFIVAIIVFWINVGKHGLGLFEKNKVDKQAMDHYAGYIVYMLVLCAQIKYILFRVNKKVMDLIVFILSVLTLVLTLNRGPITFIFSAIYIYEIFNLVKIKNRISKKKLYCIYGALIGSFLILLQFFGIIGDMRMDYVLEHVYHRTINEHYGMAESMPSGALWGYIYLTSPLENAAFALANQAVDFTFFNNLFYPFIKLAANILGFGASYKLWLTGNTAYVPYLDEKVGLSVASFIPDAMQDFGYLGIAVYIGIYVALAYFAIALIKKKIKFSALGSIIIYANILNIILWSVFDNSLKIPILILNILFIVFIELLRSYGILSLIFNKVKRGFK